MQAAMLKPFTSVLRASTRATRNLRSTRNLRFFSNTSFLEGKMSSTMNTQSVNHPAPAFKGMAVVNGAYKEISLQDYAGKWLVLFFYPLDFTFVCPTEITAFSEGIKKFEEVNCSVVGCSVDSHFTHKAWMNVDRKKGGLGGDLAYPLLADVNHHIGEAYKVMLPEGHHCRGTFIIDPKGMIRHASFNDPPVGRNLDEVLRLVTGYQHFEENGHVCPMGWTKGKKSMEPTQSGLEKFCEA